MAQITTGIRALLSFPKFYNLFQDLIGGKESRLEFINTYLSIKPNARILDIGCGTASILDYLPESITYYGMDLSEDYINKAKKQYQNRNAQFFAKSISDFQADNLELFDTIIIMGVLHHLGDAEAYGIKNCYQFNLLDPPFRQHFDAVCMFDVLEHLEDDVLAMKRIQTMLKPNGQAILTVPAHQWLWSRDDAIAFHKRRYNLKQLKSVVEAAGFKRHYFFISILPLLFLRRLLQSDTKMAVSRLESNKEITINPILNLMLLMISKFENRCFSCMPSILV